MSNVSAPPFSSSGGVGGGTAVSSPGLHSQAERCSVTVQIRGRADARTEIFLLSCVF